MKILVLESSGNENGSSNMLAKEFIRGASENGHEITEFDVSRADKLKPYVNGAASVDAKLVYSASDI